MTRGTRLRVAMLLVMSTWIASEANALGWSQLTAPASYPLTSCWFDGSSPDTGWIVGHRVSGDPVSFGYRTIDGGQTLANVPFDYYFWLAESVRFVDSNHGVAVGAGIIRTTDGGDTWSLPVSLISMRGWMYDLAFLDDQTGYAIGETYDDFYTSYWGVLYQTHDGGATWTDTIVTREDQGQNTEFRAIECPGAGTFYAGSLWGVAGSTLFKSTDAGASWTPLDFRRSVNDLWFSSPEIGYAATSVGISRTTDGGATWTDVLASGGGLMSMDFWGNFGIAVGGAGKIYETADQGLHWTEMSSPVATETLNHVEVLSPALAYAVGTNGTILRYEGSPSAVDDEVHASALPDDALLSASPNPFRAGTTLAYRVPKGGEVSVKVYDVFGREVADLVRGAVAPGNYEVEFTPGDLPDGIYFCTARSGGSLSTQKVILAR
ncbi:MAG: T9SS type A sorting domain-containing protein [Candidatus Eisenbacteria bacterium]